MPSLQVQALKSIHNDVQARVTFFNRTNFFIDVVWVNYQGHFIRYCKRLAPGKQAPLNTFVTHPWIAWQSDTLDPVKINNSYVFFPQPWQEEQQQRTVVYLDRPMLPLLDICLRRVRSLVRAEHFDQLEIPRELFHKLKERRSVNVQEAAHSAGHRH
ncbi:von Hippel-Lindau tumor suppressor [Bulinus truncatus]|nr:von Hippel-Lindau tumor suppressor [Bulinus truncatus]